MTGENIEIRPAVRREQASGWSYRPRIDILEDADGYTVLADMPGAAAQDIRVDCESRSLMIHAAVQPRQVREGEYFAQEYGVGDFDRELGLPDDVDADRIEAEYEHGVLEIRLPRSESAKPRRITVRPA
jgi:HSP20 family protein